MMQPLSHLEINLDHIQDGLRLFIDSRKPDTLFDARDSAAENNEARYQLMEGCYYDYELNNEAYSLDEIGENIIVRHKRKSNLGTISPNIFVGTLSIPIISNDERKGNLELEVQSVKTGYRDDYRDMLEFITEKCTDLLLQSNAPATHYFEVNYAKDSSTLYQRFAFVQSVIGSEEFSEAIHRIVTAPVTRWDEKTELKDIRQVRRLSNKNVKELLRGGSRTAIPSNSPLSQYNSLPERISAVCKTDSVDTPENRFIKHALEIFLKFCSDMNKLSSDGSRLEKESLLLVRELESHLHHSIFSQISRPATLKLNSPVLQRKEGYREVLRVWMMFDLAAKLIWQGGEDIYKGGKKDIATLYEYWLFFKLLELFQSVFEIEAKDISDLIKVTPDGLNLQIKQGELIALSGIYNQGTRKLNIRFNYNRSFSGGKAYPDSGSWTTPLRPDYTLSFWPHGISQEEAEQQELIVHVHFDAKYKVAHLSEQFDSDVDLTIEKTENKKGIYKNADLLKMHAYKDAIRRTGGAYVLYPGTKSVNRKGFHEIIPGLGAFPIRPSKTDSGTGELKAFILEIIDHFVNRASQREKLALRTFDIYKTPPEPGHELKEPAPEPYGKNRHLIPDETFVLVGFYKSEEQHHWIKKNNLYNFRMSTGNGSLILDKETVGARYLLLHTHGEISSRDLWKIVSKGPKVWTDDDLRKKGYKEPSPQRHYLVIELEPVGDVEFKDISWDFRKLSKHGKGNASSFPYTVSLAELMKTRVKKTE